MVVNSIMLWDREVGQIGWNPMTIGEGKKNTVKNHTSLGGSPSNRMMTLNMQPELRTITRVWIKLKSLKCAPFNPTDTEQLCKQQLTKKSRGLDVQDLVETYRPKLPECKCN